MKICVIDDDRAICRSLQLQLQGRGHEVVTGGSGREALQRASADVELVFLDLQLPDISGIRVLEQLLERADAPAVVMITGRQDMEATITAIQKGALDYIRKPLSIDAVLGAIEKVRKRRGSTSAKIRPLPPIETGPWEIVGGDRAIIEVLSRSRAPPRARWGS